MTQRVPKPLLVPSAAEEQQLMDKIDQGLKKTFASFMTKADNKSRGKELNEKRSKFYLQVK
jgi:DNA replication initiation complex subunit (GINS family)